MKYPSSAKLIKSVRLKAGLTQLEFATLLGFDSAQFVSNMERGTSAIPAKRAKKIKSLVSKDQLLKAYIDDVRAMWNEEYDQN